MSSSIDWESATLSVKVSEPIPKAGTDLPAGAYMAEQDIDYSFPSALQSALLPVNVDSQRTVSDIVSGNPIIVRSFAQVAASAKTGFATYSSDLQTVTVPYSVPLFPAIASLFVRPGPPTPVGRSLGWTPTADFTGVVIYAKGELPLYGTSQRTLFQPCLFPAIYDANMRPVLKQGMVTPAKLLSWGVAAYTTSVDLSKWQDRIGQSPARFIATGVYGVSPGDLLISPENADELLSTDHNRALLSDGRVLIIYGPETAPQAGSQ